MEAYISAHGPIPAYRVSSASPVTSRSGAHYRYWDVVPYAVYLVGGRPSARPMGRASRKYASRAKAERIAREMAERDDRVVIDGIGSDLTRSDRERIERWIAARASTR